MNVRARLALSLHRRPRRWLARWLRSEEQPYKPKPAVSGKKPSLPAVPTLPQEGEEGQATPTRSGVSRTIYAAASTPRR